MFFQILGIVGLLHMFLLFIIAGFAVAYRARYMAAKILKKSPSNLDIFLELRGAQFEVPCFIDLKKVDNREAIYYAKKNNAAALFFYIGLALLILGGLIFTVVYIKYYEQ